jgi:predicted MFS family arabinose efflux permease
MIRKSPDKASKLGQNLQQYARYSSMAFQMLGIVLAGVFGGIWIDRQIGWKFPLMTLLLSLIAVILAIYFAVKDFISKTKK